MHELCVSLLVISGRSDIVSGPQTLSPFLFSYLTFVGGKGSEGLAFSCTLRNVRVVLFVIITPT